MSDCEQTQRVLAQYIADGEPALAAYASLRAHLRGCARCQADAVRLRNVEVALHAYPRVVAPAGLAPAILHEVLHAEQPAKEEWQLFSWEVWVPILAFAVALLIAMISMPSRLLTSMTLQDLETAIHTWPSAVGSWFAPLEQLTRNDLFWVVWSSLFVTLAGLGVSLSLRHWNLQANERLHELHAHLAAMADRALQRVRSAH